MTRCKYCHTVHELDAKGRCPSCADAGDATRAGMHYGDYIAARDAARIRPIPLPVTNPEPVSRANAVKICRICGALIPPRIAPPHPVQPRVSGRVQSPVRQRGPRQSQGPPGRAAQAAPLLRGLWQTHHPPERQNLPGLQGRIRPRL